MPRYLTRSALVAVRHMAEQAMAPQAMAARRPHRPPRPRRAARVRGYAVFVPPVPAPRRPVDALPDLPNFRGVLDRLHWLDAA